MNHILKRVSLLFSGNGSFLNLLLLLPASCPAMPASLKPFCLEFVATPATVTPVEEIIRASRRVITEAECEIAVTKLCLWPHDQPETSKLLHTHYSIHPLLFYLFFFTLPPLLQALLYSKKFYLD